MSTHILEDIPAAKPPDSSRLGIFGNLHKTVGWSLEYLWHLTESLRVSRCKAVHIEGWERNTGVPVRIFYFGHGENYDFILNKLFPDYRILDVEENIRGLDIRKWMEKDTRNVDLIICDVTLFYGRMLPRDEYIRIPHWIRQQYNVPDSWEAVLQSFRKNTRKTDLRKVRKYKFTYTISTSENDYREFYHTMHVPYLRKRFDDLVIIEPEWKFLRQCRKGRLMQIRREGKVVAGVLLHMAAGRLAYVWVGVPEDIEGDMFNGAFSALYYYTIRYGYENGCREIDFLGTRPVLNDGLFHYKRKWGTRVTASPIPRGDMLLKPLRWSTPLKSFFAHTYLIAKDNGDNHLIGKILVDTHQPTRDDIQYLVNQYDTDGLKRLHVYLSEGGNSKLSSWVESHLPQVKLIDLSRCTRPAREFCRV